ncbi:MAG: HAMP domain-containing sensor histidine kinase [Planctomycetaceae bacterium]
MPADDAEFDIRLRDAKLAAMAELAAGAGHEINNPVATIVGRAQLLLANEADPNRRRALATIASQALRIRDMIGDLMLFARPPDAEPVEVDLGTIARDVVAPFADRATEANVTLTVEATEPVVAFADPLQLTVAVSALVENALTAVGGEGHVTLEVSEPDDRPTLQVRDDGGGWTDADREHAFDPFYSGRQAGRGLGFGLPKAWRIVTLAGGTIEIASPPGETIVTVTLPAPLAQRSS